MYIYVLYAAVVILSMLIIFHAFVRIKYRFWSTQPVFHKYDLNYYLFPPGIINPNLPEKTRYYRDDITFQAMNELTVTESEDFCRFIRNCYLQKEEIAYTPTNENIAAYFEGHNNKSYISIKYESEMLHNPKTNEVLERRKIASTMTTRPMFCELLFKNVSGKDILPFEMNYVDYLCVGQDYRGKGLASDNIYTHEYHVRRANKKVTVALFKREDTVMGIVPLCTFDTIGFDMRNWTKLPELQPNIGKIVRCDSSNFYLVKDFLIESLGKFDIYLYSSYGNIMELMKTNNIYVYMIIDIQGVIRSVYFFRDTCTYYDNSTSKLLSLFASVKGKRTSDELFSHGCKLSITKIVDEYKGYVYFLADDISDNHIIISNLKKKSPVYLQSPNAYFFYNFACKQFQPNKVLLIN
uniref:Glycylpeptide N-tetradecanoyltransferase n=1 Tax=viral metagenome TaxID=1070528 RepID=A0A6C0FDF7_9ZZZZ